MPTNGYDALFFQDFICFAKFRLFFELSAVLQKFRNFLCRF